MLHLPRRGRALRHDVLGKKKKSSLLEVGWARGTAAGAAPGSSPPQRLVSALQLRLSGGSTRRPVLQATCTARLEERRREEMSRSWEPRSTMHGSPEPQRARAGGRHQSRGSSGWKRWEKQRTTHF